MPELPEVETIKRQLKKVIIGKKIAAIKIKLAKFVNLPEDQFRRFVKGAIIKNIWRRAKILIFELDNGWSILIHLKLTGQLIFQIGGGQPQGDPRTMIRGSPLPNQYTHVIYEFTNGTKLFHNDLRQFGFERLIKTKEIAAYWQKEKLGPEPLDPDFTLADFAAMLKKRSRSPIKPLLMDQKFIAGIGNIYSDEALFEASILPTRKAVSLTATETAKLYQAIRKVLQRAIKKRGSSVKYFLDARGRRGGFVPYLEVYGRQGQTCQRCGAKIIRLKLRGRSAHYCPKCQK